MAVTPRASVTVDVDVLVKAAVHFDRGLSGPAAHHDARTDIVKSLAEQRYVLGVAHPAGWRDSIAKGLDGNRDYMTAAELEKAAWGYMLKGRQVGLGHDGWTPSSGVSAATPPADDGHVQVCESYIYRGPDWTVTDRSGNAQIIKSGDWLIGAVLDEPTWADFKAGKFNGWSVQGIGTRRTRVTP